MVTNLTSDQAKHLISKNLDNPDFVIVDVRTAEELRDGLIKGYVLIDITRSDFMDCISRLERGKTYLIYCRSGNRSAAAARVMERMGFTKVYNLLDGIIAWKKEGFDTG